MGAWGADIFDNDEAFDLVDELEETNDFAAIERTLTAVLDTDD